MYLPNTYRYIKSPAPCGNFSILANISSQSVSICNAFCSPIPCFHSSTGKGSSHINTLTAKGAGPLWFLGEQKLFNFSRKSHLISSIFFCHLVIQLSFDLLSRQIVAVWIFLIINLLPCYVPHKHFRLLFELCSTQTFLISILVCLCGMHPNLCKFLHYMI